MKNARDWLEAQRKPNMNIFGILSSQSLTPGTLLSTWSNFSAGWGHLAEDITLLKETPVIACTCKQIGTLL